MANQPTTGRVGVAQAEAVPDALLRDRAIQCSRCGHCDPGVHIDGEGFVCSVCLDRPVGHVYVPAPQPEPQAAAPAEGVDDALLPWLRSVVAYARRGFRY